MRKSTIGGIAWRLSAVAVLLVAIGCAVNPATGERQLMLISEEQEIAMGKEAHGQILASMGVYQDDQTQAYVAAIGQQLAALSERPNLPWTFTVIDDPIVNAFALPGGYIYVTRGIMTHLSSEAELVSVLGHEIGHVTGRHGANRMSKAQLASIGLGVGMIASPKFARFGDLAQQGVGLLFLKYSRDDERQADDLGVRYTVNGGWDVREMPAVFGVLKNVSQLSGAGRLPNWLSTHPDPDNRARRINEQIGQLGRDFTNAKRNRPTYFDRLDGMVFGADPRQGYFEERTFFHPELAFKLVFPEGWSTQNQTQAVVGQSQEQDAIVALTLESEADLQAAAKAFLSQEGLEAGRTQSGRIHGFPAVKAEFKVPREENSIYGQVGFVRYKDNTYRLLGYTLESKWSTYGKPIANFIGSFDKVTDRRVLSVQPARVKVVQLRRDTPFAEFARRYPSPSVKPELLALINHTTPEGVVPAGDAKQVVGGR
ncbi:MAG: M48 family metalloprotease [Thermoanaerobaculia bacterium]